MSRLLRERVSRFSVERLFEILNRLGYTVELRITHEDHYVPKVLFHYLAGRPDWRTNDIRTRFSVTKRTTGINEALNTPMTVTSG